MGGIGPDVELGYTLARSAWGRGYATELGGALVEYAFTVLRVPRVVAQVEPANTASRHVLAKLGMTERAERTAYGRPHLLYVLDGMLRGSSRPRSDRAWRPCQGLTGLRPLRRPLRRAARRGSGEAGQQRLGEARAARSRRATRSSRRGRAR